ncbi:MAG: endonuclease [Bacteroidales bacterium]
MQKRINILQTFLFILLTPMVTVLQGQDREYSFSPESERELRLMFYNVENAFDTINDPEKNDKEFLPNAIRNWNSFRYFQKIKKIYKVIVAAGGWKPPELIGLCEVENANVLRDLANKTPLSKYQYQFVHKNSPDQRGIDVALLYNPEKFKLLATKYVHPELPEQYRSTRYILYAKGTSQSDTLHIFVNHWPSKWGGEKSTEPKRIVAAKTLRRLTDSIFKTNKKAKIIITGDFNDKPENKSITDYLKTLEINGNIKVNRLYNLSTRWTKASKGTYKYQAHWSVLDQFMVSGSLLVQNEKLSTTSADAHIFKFSSLLEKDKKHMGVKPFRTFSGYRYIGGYSDHLPILLDLK